MFSNVTWKFVEFIKKGLMSPNASSNGEGSSSVNFGDELDYVNDYIISKYSFDYYVYLIKVRLNNYFIYDAIKLAKQMTNIDPNNRYMFLCK